MVSLEYYKGKIVAFGNTSVFSSLGQEYGFSAFDNDILIGNIFRWLTSDIEVKGKVINVRLNIDLYYWLQEILKKEKWENFSDLINVSLKYFKDKYNDIIEDIKKIKFERIDKRKALEKTKQKISEDSEEKILEKLPNFERKKEDLEKIMDALEEITGEKYEISIDFEEDEEEDEDFEELNGVTYTNEDIEEFEKGFPKKAIWKGKITHTFRQWLKKKYAS